MNIFRKRAAVFVVLFLLFAGCSGMEMQGAFYGLYYGLGAVGVASEFVGDYKTVGMDLGPGVAKEELLKIKKYAFIQPWSMKKGLPDDIHVIVDTFLTRLIQEIGKVSADKITAEDELLATSAALKDASDIAPYIKTAHGIDLEAVMTTNLWITKTGYRIIDFQFVMWDTRAAAVGGKRLLVTMRGEFKTPQDINAAAVSIANMFFKAASAPAEPTK